MNSRKLNTMRGNVRITSTFFRNDRELFEINDANIISCRRNIERRGSPRSMLRGVTETNVYVKIKGSARGSKLARSPNK